jgi:hypothetical protein
VLGNAQIDVQYGPRAQLVAVSEGKVGRGFLICESCGWGTSLVAEFPKSHARLVGPGTCKGSLKQLSLAHSFETDMLTLRGSGDMAELLQSPSVLYAILEGASRDLDIARDDVDGALYRTEDGAPSLAFFDTVPGGAGNVLRMGLHLTDVLRRAQKVVSSCDCGPETSCYACLRTFRNERFHDQLRRGEAAELLSDVLQGPKVAARHLSDPGLPAEWSAVMALAETREEQELVAALAAEDGIPVPNVGVEVADGIPVSLAWPAHRVAVLLDGEAADADDLQRSGWRLAEPSPQSVRALLASTN